MSLKQQKKKKEVYHLCVQIETLSRAPATPTVRVLDGEMIRQSSGRRLGRVHKVPDINFQNRVLNIMTFFAWWTLSLDIWELGCGESGRPLVCKGKLVPLQVWCISTHLGTKWGSVLESESTFNVDLLAALKVKAVCIFHPTHNALQSSTANMLMGYFSL